MHRHTWKVKSTFTMLSPWEMLNQGGAVTEMGRVSTSLFVQPVIVTYACACGAEKVERV
jgi:hypothetical protein